MHVAVVAVSFQLSPGESDTLRGIGEAFASAVDRGHSAPIVALIALLLVGLVIATVRFLRREAERERSELLALEEVRERVASAAPPGRVERREFVRVATHIAMTVLRRDGAPRAHYDVYETQNVGGGGVAFLSGAPPTKGATLEFSLDLGERAGLAMKGVVVRVDAPPMLGTPSLVAVRFSEISNATREHLMHWIAAQEVRELVEAHRGRVCPHCARPLSDTAEVMHSTCAAMAAAAAAAKPAA